MIKTIWKQKECYISVPMEGRKDLEVSEDLNKAEKELRARGYEPRHAWQTDVNPDLTLPFPVLMGNDIRALLECEAFCYVGTQEELKTHKGCSVEVATAMIYEREIVKL